MRENDTKCSCVVSRLFENHEYMFKIQAINEFGHGEALVSNSVTAKNSFGM